MTDSRQAAREHAILAAYADNVPVEEIAARHAMTVQDVERLAADEVEMPQPAARCPGPVITAALLTAAAGVGNAVQAHTSIGGTEGTVVALIGAALYAVVGWGLFKGWRACQVLAVIGGGLSVFAGLAGGGLLGLVVGAGILGLLLIPVSAREWFGR